MALIRASDGVLAETVSLHTSNETSRVTIFFVLAVDAASSPSDSGILGQEAIGFIWGSIDVIGLVAPNVVSARLDFPTTLQHLFPVRDESLVALCLATAGLQPTYDRYGIEGVLDRLRRWMRDAAAGDLAAGGWHPVPLPSGTMSRLGWLDPWLFQEMTASRRSTGGIAAGTAFLGGQDAIPFPQLDPTEYPHDAFGFNGLNHAVRKADVVVHGSEPPRRHIPWLFLWHSSDQSISHPVFGDWRTLGDMIDGLEPFGLGQRLLDAVVAAKRAGSDFKHWPGRKTLVVLIGIWRPVPLAANIYGLSQDPDLRRLEIKGFTVEQTDIWRQIDDRDASVHNLLADPFPGPRLFRWVTATPMLGKAGLIGYGALGSAIGNHLLRSGIDECVVIDNDRINAHNLARHEATTADIWRLKGLVASGQATEISNKGDRTKVSVHGDDVGAVTDAVLVQRLQGTRLIVDATADELVRARLTRFSDPEHRQIVRTELYHGGRLGVQFVTSGSGAPNLVDLYYLLCRAALDDQNVADWILSGFADGSDAEELVFGFGCASLTTKLPNFVVAAHAAAFMPTIMAGLQGETPAGFGINKLDEQLRPAGWHWFDSPVLKEFNSPMAPGWTVHVDPAVIEQMVAQRREGLPAETGGYLYGGFDVALKHIVILEATGLPPDSKATPTFLELGPSGRTNTEIRIRRKTRGRLRLCGTWHSHPDNSASMSPTDRQTFDGHRQNDRQWGVPTLLMIVADGDVQLHLEA